MGHTKYDTALSQSDSISMQYCRESVSAQSQTAGSHYTYCGELTEISFNFCTGLKRESVTKNVDSSSTNKGLCKSCRQTDVFHKAFGALPFITIQYADYYCTDENE